MAAYDPRAHGCLCDKCPLRGQRVVPPEVNRGATVLIVGEAPDELSEKLGRPFLGQSGQELDRAIGSAGLRRGQVTLTTAILCKPPKGEMGKILERVIKGMPALEAMKHALDEDPVKCCAPRLESEIASFKNIIVLGKTAVRSVLQTSNSILAIRGGLHELADGTKVLPTVHPSFVMHQPRWTHVFRSDIAKAARWFRGDSGWTEPKITLQPTLEQLREFLRRDDILAFDLETDGIENLTAKIRCVGISTSDEAMVVITMGKDPWSAKPSNVPGSEWVPEFYTPRELDEIIDELKQWFVDPTRQKCSHNGGSYDFNVLRSQWGIEVEGNVDTILLHKSVESELPHSLAFVGALYTDAPPWKTGRDDQKLATGAETDEELAIYCVYEGTRVMLADGSTRSIETIVRNKQIVDVLSLSATGEIEARPVTNWHYNVEENVSWYQVRFDGDDKRERGLVVTDKHELIGPNGRVQAQHLQIGDGVYSSEIEWSEDERSAVIGTLLGDSSLSLSPTWRNSDFAAAPSAALQGHHTTKSGLTAWKVSELHFLHEGKGIAAKDMEANGRKGRSGPTSPYRSQNLRQLPELAPLLYEGRKKRLRVEALEMGGPRAWAWWYADDGCKQKKKDLSQETMVLSTQCFPREDIDAAVAWFREKFGPTSAGKDGVIRLASAASQTFASAIAPYLPPEARYKLPHLTDVDWNAVPYIPVVRGGVRPTVAHVVSIVPFVPDLSTKQGKYRARRRYCISVEANHNFFTTSGLVSNCAKDCVVTRRVLPRLIDTVLLRGQMGVFQLDTKIQRVCSDMHAVGMYVDQEKRLKEEKRLLELRFKTLKNLREMLGDSKFNPGSVFQLRDLLFSKWRLDPPLEDEEKLTKSGDPSTGDLVLRALLTQQTVPEKQREIIKTIRAFRKVQKLIGTYVTKLRYSNVAIEKDLMWDPGEQEEPSEEDSWLDDKDTKDRYGIDRMGITNPLTGRMYPGYNAHVAVTGRLSSSRPINSQNFPKVLRAMVTAAPGHVLIGADMDQLELRIIAAIYNVDLYLRAFQQNKDPHSMTAFAVFGEDFCRAATINSSYFHEEGKLVGGSYDDNGKFIGDGEAKKMRDMSKNIQYASQYMAAVETVHKLITKTEVTNKDGTTDLPYALMPLRKVWDMRENWLKGAPEFESGWKQEIEMYREQLYLMEEVTFRRRDFLDGENPNELVNYRVQGSAAGLMNLAILELAKEIPLHKWGPGTGIINQCHDAIVVECPADGARSYVVKDEVTGKEKTKWHVPPGSIPARVMAMLEEHMNMDHPALPGVRFTATADIGHSWKEV